MLDWSSISLFAFGSLVLSHLLMALLRKHPKAHQILRYVAGILGSVSIFLALSETEAKLADESLPGAELRRSITLSHVQTQIAQKARYYCEFEPRRTEYSPDNFDQIVQSIEDKCRIIGSVAKKLEARDEEAGELRFPEFETEIFSTEVDEDWLRFLEMYVSSYNDEHTEVLQLRENVNPSGFYSVLVRFAPYSLIFAFCFGLAGIAFPVKEGD